MRTRWSRRRRSRLARGCCSNALRKCIWSTTTSGTSNSNRNQTTQCFGDNWTGWATLRDADHWGTLIACIRFLIQQKICRSAHDWTTPKISPTTGKREDIITNTTRKNRTLKKTSPTESRTSKFFLLSRSSCTSFLKILCESKLISFELWDRGRMGRLSTLSVFVINLLTYISFFSIIISCTYDLLPLMLPTLRTVRFYSFKLIANS